MNFLVGAPSRITNATDRTKSPKKGQLEARVLAVRPARRAEKEPVVTDRRDKPRGHRDPVGGRVILLLVPEGANLPSDLTTEQHRVFLRFKKR